MSEHWLKIATEYFDDILIGKKTFEVRKDDRIPAYADDDILHLQEYTNCEYTGREITVRAMYVLRDNRFCKDGFCIIGYIPPIVWAEYNTGRGDYADNEKLRLLIWNAELY